MQSNTFREENTKLKTKVKILENELAKKERTIEEFFQQNINFLASNKMSNVSSQQSNLQTASSSNLHASQMSQKFH